MLNKSKKSKSEGFTIIEVMIVLAIAGLIMLIVFLAVPALQRNSRNTGRANDAGRIATAASNYVSNNNGKLPDTTASAAGRAAAQSILDDAKEFSQYSNLVVANNAATNSFSIAIGRQAALANIDAVRLVKSAKCDTATPGATAPGSARQMALQFNVEKSGGVTPRCTDI